MKSSSEQIKNRSRIKNLDLFFMSSICLYISVIFNTSVYNVHFKRTGQNTRLINTID